MALWLADWNAQWGDYHQGLHHLEAADELSGGALGRRLTGRQRSWQRALERAPELEGSGAMS
jgi:hypothetical protein